MPGFQHLLENNPDFMEGLNQYDFVQPLDPEISGLGVVIV